MLFTELVAVQTAFARFFARERFETNDLGNISATLGVSLSRAMTCFTALILHASMVEHCLPVRTMIVGLGNIVVAGSTGIRAGVKRWIGRIGADVVPF